jgi:hypothetical protein
MQHPQLGLYKHYKGNRYRVLGISKHSETQEELVVYQAQYGSRQIWVRPLASFMQSVLILGQEVPRFQLIEENGQIKEDEAELEHAIRCAEAWFRKDFPDKRACLARLVALARQTEEKS